MISRGSTFKIPLSQLASSTAQLTNCVIETEGWLRLNSKNASNNLILQTLLDEGIEVLGLAEESSDLETLFIQSTKGDAT